MTVPISPPGRPVSGADSTPQASRGQILIMFAFFLVAMIGMLGLAVDLGFAFAGRRSMQNAADAAALAGARIVAKSSPSAPLSAGAEVQTVANANGMRHGTITSVACQYINDAGSSLGSCAGTVPSGASGVSVTVTESHSTFFIQVVPGAPDSVTTSAQAKANVKKLAAPRDGPFLPCAVKAKRPSGGPMDIMIKVGGQWVINPDAIGHTFEIHGPSIETCNAKSSRFKGLADNEWNRDKSAPGWFMYKEGDAAGLISQDVEGPDGCKAGQEVVNCVAFLPIVINEPPETDNGRTRWAVGFAPFYITAPKSNNHYGKLLGDYVVYGSKQDADWGWTPDYTGPIVIRLTK